MEVKLIYDSEVIFCLTIDKSIYNSLHFTIGSVVREVIKEYMDRDAAALEYITLSVDGISVL
jgi:hypothetical protein